MELKQYNFVRGDKLFSSEKMSVCLVNWNYGQISEFMHYHDFHELVYVRSGSGIHITEEGRCPIHRGDVFLIKPYSPHTYEELKNLELANFIYRHDSLKPQLLDLRESAGYRSFFESEPVKPGRLRSCSRAVLSNEQLQRTEEIILQILREEELRQEGWMCMVAALFLQFAGIVCRACPASRREENDRSLKFRRILNYLDEHSGRIIRLDTLAADFGLSKSSLLRMFREMLGTSPIDHLLNLRLEKGARRLRDGSESIIEIAVGCGFGDGNYFSKMFRRKFGVSPRDYRKRFIAAESMQNLHRQFAFPSDR